MYRYRKTGFVLEYQWKDVTIFLRNRTAVQRMGEEEQHGWRKEFGNAAGLGDFNEDLAHKTLSSTVKLMSLLNNKLLLSERIELMDVYGSVYRRNLMWIQILMSHKTQLNKCLPFYLSLHPSIHPSICPPVRPPTHPSGWVKYAT
jgi:hypothetical protein